MCYIRLLCSFLHVQFHFWKTHKRNIIIVETSLSFSPCPGQKTPGREDWLLRPSPVPCLPGSQTLCPYHPSALSLCQNKRYPCNPWGHENTRTQKKRNELFDIHILKHKNCRPSGKDKYFPTRIWPVAYMRKPTHIKHRGSATRVSIWWVKQNLVFFNKWERWRKRT